MAVFVCSVSQADIALTLNTTKTLLQIAAPTNQRLRLIGWGVFFSGIDPVAAPILVQIVRQSTAGTMSPATEVPRNIGAAEVPQAVALHTATVEPTTGDVVDQVEVHGQSGYEVKYAVGEEPIVGGGGRLGLRIVADNPAINVTAKMIWEE